MAPIGASYFGSQNDMWPRRSRTRTATAQNQFYARPRNENTPQHSRLIDVSKRQQTCKSPAIRGRGTKIAVFERSPAGRFHSKPPHAIVKCDEFTIVRAPPRLLP